MVRALVHRLVGLLVALVVGVGLHWLVGDVTLASVTGLTWGVGAVVTLRIARLYPAHATGTTWTDRRWTGLGVGLVTLAALVGVSPTLPVSDELRFGLGFLVLGAGFAGYVTATVAELERAGPDR